MAIYHFSAKIISRATGSSALAAAAYRSASRLHDRRLDRHHDFSNKAGVVHSEVLLPEGAPEQLSDRATLWNAVEAAELRKDAQLAREVEFALPRELDQVEGIRLAREFVAREFVARGMVADLNVHWDVGADGEAKPHAHVMLTTRSVDEEGFGAKVRDWNRTDLLEHWREAWAEHVNQRLAELDIDARVDHRSLEAQGIDLEPQHKIGPAASRMAAQGLQIERVDEHRTIARSNGEKLLTKPDLALDGITHGQATFTTRDLAKFVHRHSDGKEQFDKVMAAARASPELVKLGRDSRGEERFTSREMLATEQRLEQALDRLGGSVAHRLGDGASDRMLERSARAGLVLGPEQQAALRHVVQGRDLGIVVGYAGTGKSTMLGLARKAWEEAGYRVQGGALSGIAAENLENGSGIASRTLASLERQWEQGRELLSAGDVLVIDEAGMIGSRQMERVLSQAAKHGAKVVLVGDPEQLQAIEAGAAFRSAVERYGHVEITDIRRQREDWQRDATRQLATERPGEALDAYVAHGAVHAAPTREAARVALVDRWDQDRADAPQASRIILTHTNDEVRLLNQLARERLKRGGELGDDVAIATERGERQFASGDRIMFLRNERSLGVKNGSLGRVESVTAGRMTVLLDDGRSVGFDVKDYAAVDHGYAATIHKAQGMTVDRVQVLATPGLDRHASYVALSRHRDAVELHYGRDDFADHDRLAATLSRERAKDMVSDYVREPAIRVSRAFAERRGIGDPRDTPAPTRRSMFDGLKLNVAAPSPEPRRSMFDGLRLRVSDPTPAVDPAADLGAAVRRYAVAFAEVDEAERAGRSPLPHMRVDLEKAVHRLDRAQPNGTTDLRLALRRNPALIEDARNGRTSPLVQAMALEREMRTDPMRRADRFVDDWQALDRRRASLERGEGFDAATRVRQQMRAMAKGLEHDPQVESLLRNRTRELGLKRLEGASISHELQNWLGVSRSRGLGR
ncbi:Ti-type conjugative transfer relaxase TraA [Sphingomonas sp. PL-96]|uniref:Ti-type conjugative transfer relaxase TraA n=1 Tax=Sphingomonas sp. PL-96 TaxID=2887201 RepID=UPI001E57B85D|nr:Ti-type conjugative transfer relaxase TraA [Sphingomonas sp. PL-96]MCC2977960.1 Ti-type conjugative transfer relaxase TraA [Sphingomonas sp. PL-96]